LMSVVLLNAYGVAITLQQQLSSVGEKEAQTNHPIISEATYNVIMKLFIATGVSSGFIYVSSFFADRAQKMEKYVRDPNTPSTSEVLMGSIRKMLSYCNRLRVSVNNLPSSTDANDEELKQIALVMQDVGSELEEKTSQTRDQVSTQALIKSRASLLSDFNAADNSETVLANRENCSI
jgi:hypothetical protein